MANTFKHTVVDVGLGFFIGTTIDAVFERIHTANSQQPGSATEVAMLTAKCLAQIFVSTAVAIQASDALYPGEVGDDPTNGLLLLGSVIAASKHLQTDYDLLHLYTKAWLDKMVFPEQKSQ